MTDDCVEIIVLPLYNESQAEGKYVQPQNNINLWNAAGRQRNENEVNLAIPPKFRLILPFFFPGDGKAFDLRLPNYVTLSAKLAREGSLLTSNPSAELGKWILRQVLRIPAGTVVTYEMLEKRGIDALYFEKCIENGNVFYRVFPAPVGEYEKFVREGIKERKQVLLTPQSAREAFINRMTAGNNAANTQTVIDIKAGDSIRHKIFGEGLVKAVNNDMVDLDFKGTTKTFKYSWLKQNNMIS